MIVIWGLAYQLIHIAAAVLAGRTGKPWITGCSLLGYTVCLLLWVICTGKSGQIYLTVPKRSHRADLLPGLLLLSVPVWNSCSAESIAVDPAAVAVILSVSIVEEIFFRGFFLRFLTRYGQRRGILLSGLIFACYHAFNIFSGSGSLYTAVQILFALIAGVCLGQLTLRYDSLLPGTILHFLINITGFTHTDLSVRYLGGFIPCLLCYLWAALYFRHKDP